MSGNLTLAKCDEMLEHLGRARMAEQVALSLVTSHRAQQIELRFGFDPLGDHPHAQAAAQGDHGLDDRGGGRVVGHVGDEAAVHLEFAEGKAAETMQNRGR